MYKLIFEHFDYISLSAYFTCIIVIKVLEKSYKALGYEDLRDDMLKIISLNYPDNDSTVSENTGWSWSLIRNSKPEPDTK